MCEESASTERNVNIWAPWRMEYIDSLAEEDTGCFLCRHRDTPEEDRKNLVLWRGRKCFVMLNLFPYTGGHSLVAPLDHVATLDDVDDETMLEMMWFVRDLQRVLGYAIRAQGFNVGMNVGRCAGAGLPGHVHLHVVPRWPADTNFMSVLGKRRVISQSLEALYTQLRQAGEQLQLPRRTPQSEPPGRRG